MIGSPQQQLETGFALDRRWHELRGEMQADKKASLFGLARVLESSGVPWALIGGVALQIRQDEPRTTLDIDIAVLDRADVPRVQLEGAGFRNTGVFLHSENWEGPDGTPLQFADDPVMAAGVREAERIEIDGVALRVATSAALLRMKLRAAADPGRRRSKRTRDLADAIALVEQEPGLVAGLSEAERAQLEG